MKGTIVDGCIQKLFAGIMKSILTFKNDEYKKDREEIFYDVQLNIAGNKNSK